MQVARCKAAWLSLGLVLHVAGVGCNRDEAQTTNKTTVEAKTIVSLAPVATEICAALGVRERVIGRTRFCTYPEAVTAIPIVGDAASISLETLQRKRPDIVLTCGNSATVVERIRSIGLDVLELPDQTLADLYTAIREVGKAVDRAAAADALCQQIEADLAAIVAEHANLPKRSVLITIGRLANPPRPLFVAGPGSFYDDLLKRAGQRNAAPDGAKPFGPLSFEAILQANPDVIIALSDDDEFATGAARPDEEARRRWKDIGPLQAVAHDCVFVISGRQHYLLGPRVPETLRELLNAIRECERPDE